MRTLSIRDPLTRLFNRTKGHDAGDVLLRELGEFLHTNIQDSDIGYHYGGEEFMIVMPDISRLFNELCQS
ncbi:MAG: diguanylate cyclase [Nitrospirae bacterium]|nr:diguanylate cyclase [Nitrospirota bacterium]